MNKRIFTPIKRYPCKVGDFIKCNIVMDDYNKTYYYEVDSIDFISGIKIVSIYESTYSAKVILTCDISKIIPLKEEKEMIEVTVIGSLSRSEDMQKVKEVLGNIFYKDCESITVNIPCESRFQDRPLLTNQIDWFNKIKRSDFIVAIPKDITINDNCCNDRSTYKPVFGESTSYEIAIAKNFNKPIFIWDNLVYFSCCTEKKKEES